MLRLLRGPTPPHRHFIKHLLTISTSTLQPQSETAAFLRTNAGLTSDAALSIASKIQLKSLDNARSTLSLLKQFHYTHAQIASLITRYPKILNTDAQKFLEPKLRFYRDIGLDTSTIAINPQMLYASLDRRLLPNFQLVSSFFNGDDKKLFTLLRKAPLILKLDLQRVMVPRIRLLRESNVPTKMISQLIFHHARSFFPRNERFEEALEELKRLGMGPNHSLFAHALGVFAQMPKCFWERNMRVYGEFGWSKDQVVAAFFKSPFSMSLSVEKLGKNLRFYKEKVGWGPEILVFHPTLLSFSLEKRLLPRYATWEILSKKGLLGSSVDPYFFKMTEQNFLAKYVYACMDKAPEVLEVNRISIC